jgi:hypothetical protein
MARRPPKPAAGTPEGPVRIEPLRMADVASAVELVRHVLRVDPGDRGEQFVSDITDDSRQMLVAKTNGQIIAYGRVAELAAGEAAREHRLAITSAACSWTRRGEAGVSPRRRHGPACAGSSPTQTRRSM